MVVKHIKKPPDVFQTEAGPGLAAPRKPVFHFNVGPLSDPGETLPELTSGIHPWPISGTSGSCDGLLSVPELKPPESPGSMQVGPR